MTATECERTGLLADIIDTPDDDAPRHIFADWLQDQGEYERAEFIRVQIALAKAETYIELMDGLVGAASVSAQEMRDKCAGLLDTWQTPGPEYHRLPGTRVRARHAWAGAAANLDDPNESGWFFRRGFIEEVTATFEQWEKHGPLIARTQPLRCVTLADVNPVEWSDDSRSDYGWWDASRFALSTSHALPSSIWNALCDYTAVTGNWKWYDSEQAALLALSVALIKVARAQM
jgi:uncharacterized protein (TIGR02996 family)